MRKLVGGFLLAVALVIFFCREWVAGFVVLAFAVYFIASNGDDDDSGSGFEFELGGGGGDGGGGD